MACVSFGTEIASMRGAMAEKNVRRQMRTDRRTAFQLYIYDVSSSTVLKFTFNLTKHTLENVRRLENTVNLLGMEPWLSIRQFDALTGVSMALTDVF